MKLIMSIVPRKRGEHITAVAKKSGAGGATIILGKGTAKNEILELLGLGGSEKDIIVILAENTNYKQILDAIFNESSKEKKGFGILFTLNTGMAVKNSMIIDDSKEEKINMLESSTHKLISVIVNSGFADEVMVAARKAGAGGGTVINARGTGKEEDAKFFGITIIPEKEMLLILVENSKCDIILEEIRNLDCLKEKGSGIAYCVDVSNFMGLGGDVNKK